MPINLTDTDDPHHSLLFKPEPEPVVTQEVIDEIEEDDETLNDGKPHNPPIVKDSVYWWGKSRK